MTTLAAYVGAASGNSGGGSAIGTLLLPVLLVAIVYFGFIRPQRARARRAQQLSKGVEVGQEVMTTAGLYGTVVEVDEDTVRIEIAPGVTTRWAIGAVARVTTPVEPGGDDFGADTPKADDAGGAGESDDTHPDNDPGR